MYRIADLNPVAAVTLDVLRRRLEEERLANLRAQHAGLAPVLGTGWVYSYRTY